MRRHRLSVTRSLAAVMVLVLIAGPATGSPGDIFSISAPAIGADPPQAAPIDEGDTSVATQTGAFGYSYPIKVPPGRNGIEPHLALAYSSQAPIYGGIAAGWTLTGVPEIRLDTSQGRLKTQHPGVEAQQSDPRADDQFLSTMAGGRPLVPVTEPAPITLAPGVYRQYRAQNDTTFTRYERMNVGAAFPWRAYSAGNTYLFGEAAYTSGCTSVGEHYAPLTSVMDPFGNTIQYIYEAGVSGEECRLKSIFYGQNPVAPSGPIAHVDLTWASEIGCAGVPVGTQIDWRTGKEIITGASRLVQITAYAHEPGMADTPEHTRVYSLGYASESCTTPYAALRLLTSIQEVAWGNDSPEVTLPPITFDYGDPTLALPLIETSIVVPWGAAAYFHAANLAWGRRFNDDRWPTVEAMLLDVDGDGLPDRIISQPDTTGGVTRCRARWYRNQGNFRFASTPFDIYLPMLKWASGTIGTTDRGANPDTNIENCALNGQVTHFHNSTNESGGTCRNRNFPYNPVQCCGPTCTSNPTMFCPNGDTCDLSIHPPNQKTYLAYRWIDIDGDGLVDLVAAVHGDHYYYDVDQGYLQPPEPGLPTLTGGWVPFPGCPQQSTCESLGTICTASPTARSCPSPTATCTVNWSVVDSCMASAPPEPCYQHIEVLGPTPQPDGGGGKDTGGSGSYSGQRLPLEKCFGMYPWLVYKNRGNGVFDATPLVKYQPVPLESDAGDSALVGGVVATDHGILDLDGDGIPDAVVRARDADITSPTDPWWWFVFRGDGRGGFELGRYLFETTPYAALNAMNTDLTFGPSAGFVDINGDGLPDHWITSASGLGNANVAMNDGVRFRIVGPNGATKGEIETPAFPTPLKPATDAISRSIVRNGSFVVSGQRELWERLVDVDGDGRPDIVQNPSATAPPVVFFNEGGNFNYLSTNYPGTTTSNPAQWPAGIHALTTGTVDGSDPYSPYLWEVKQDIADLDGDGIPESYQFASNGSLSRLSGPRAGSPPRLLIAIHNGAAGLSTLDTTIDYRSLHDSTVEQHPDQAWTDVNAAGHPKAMPSNQWVADHVTVRDSVANTTSTTSYHYIDPRFSPDDRGKYGFRGFAEVRTTLPSGAVKAERFGYDVDWSGLLVATLTYPTTALAEVRTIDKTTFEARQLFAGAITTFHPTVKEHLVCKNGQTEAACTSSTGAAYTRTTATLSACPIATSATGACTTATTATAGSLLWRETGTLLQLGTALATSDRQTTSSFDVLANSVTYRVRQRETTRLSRATGAMVMYAKSRSDWDPTYRVPEYDNLWVDSVDANRAVTHRVYDMTTGNVIRRWKPVQYAAGTTSLTLTYDSRKLFPALAIDEKGHELDTTYEPGTGAKLVTSGPNVRTCTTNCPTDALHPVKETHQIRVDGLGRPIERWETLSNDGSVYTLTRLETTSYGDSHATPATPTTVTNQKLITSDSPVQVQTRTDLDGHRRPMRTTVFAQGSAPADRVTTFHYNDDGTLGSVDVPDPSANDASIVTYTYGYDTLGRPTSIRRPDSTTPASRSGTDVSYDGVFKTTSEVVGPAGGQAAVTRTRVDSFGRLFEVDERTSTSPTWATTVYHYAPDDHVDTIIDPEGVVTTLLEDFAGRRTKIIRGGRTWTYGYDKNGNVISEQVPGSASPSDDVNYMSTIAYDDLDRPTSKVNARRNQTAADLALFGDDHETFTYDYPGNRIGRLVYWGTYAPGAATATLAVQNGYDAQGHLFNIRQVFSGAGYTNLPRSYRNDKRLDGQPWVYFYDDLVGGTNQTIGRVYFDNRGLPQKYVVQRTGMANQDIAVQTRNVAGLVTNRRTAFSTGPMPFVESNWTYDKLGRVASQVVQQGPSPTQVARQDLTYFGNDDPATLDEWLGTTNHKQFHYNFDLRHQLVGVTESAQNAFGASYTFDDAGRFLSAQETAASLPNSDVKPRNVAYQYADPDRERVTALTNATDGTTYASYSYDDAGNQTNRTAHDDSYDYLYDGMNQLRRATKKHAGVVTGSEEYWYDAGGKRTVIVKRDASGAKSELVWFFGDTEAHYDATGAITHIESHLTLGTPVARVDRTSNATTQLELQFHGIANNTLAAVDQSGTVDASFSYAPFGEVIEATDAGSTLGEGVAAHRRRFNDQYSDELTDLAYYGARYYDKTLIGWTQGDPRYRVAPDTAGSEPRRANTYMFSLANPVRYVDPDGKDPADVANQIRIPTREEFMAIVEGYGELATARDNHDWILQERQQASLNAVEYLQRSFNVKTSASTIAIESNPTQFGEPLWGQYNPFTNTITLSLEITDADNVTDVVRALLVLVHESVHSEQDFGFPGPSTELEAYRGSLDVLLALFRAQLITPEQYQDLRSDIDEGIEQEERWLRCTPCQKIPELHENPDLFRESYRKHTMPFIETLWGLEVNPDGPLAWTWHKAY